MSAAGAGGRQPYSRASLAGTRFFSAREPSLGFLLWLSQAGFHPLSTKPHRSAERKRKVIIIPKDVV